MNSVGHFELPARDMKKLAAFYEQLFGWKPEPMGSDYTMVNPPEGIAGGLKPDTRATLIYIEVEDIAAKLREIEVAGGVVVTPEAKVESSDGENRGKIGFFKDPNGTLIGMWSR